MSTAGTLYDETITNGFGKLLTVNTITSNVSFVDFSIPTGYDTFWFDITGIQFTTSNEFLSIVTSTDGGGSFGNTSNYVACLRLLANYANVGQYQTVENAASMLTFAFVGTGPAHVLSGRIRMRPNINLFAWRLAGFGDSYLNHTCFGGGRWWSTTPINYIRFTTWNGVGSQYKAGGVIRLYGIKTGT